MSAHPAGPRMKGIRRLTPLCVETPLAEVGAACVAIVAPVRDGVLRAAVETTEGFEMGDMLLFHDIQAGDRFLLPATTVFSKR